MNDLLFVCGTLLPELVPAALQEIVARFQFIGSGVVRGRMYDLGEYPGAVPDESADALIVGKVFRLPADEALLKALDEYEGFDPYSPQASLFVRTRCTVRMSDGQTLSCWMYAYNRPTDGLPLIADGDYLKHREQTERKH
ncbi:MAG TPA: gamma-glutamylcyclotransferase family protein [Blastocatellia bacterium]|nr:gamma-glutamylcyclotransferase family protein [Blastocatellia bacterium]